MINRCNIYIICDKVIRVRMPHCELKWEMSFYSKVDIEL